MVAQAELALTAGNKALAADLDDEDEDEQEEAAYEAANAEANMGMEYVDPTKVLTHGQVVFFLNMCRA